MDNIKDFFFADTGFSLDDNITVILCHIEYFFQHGSGYRAAVYKIVNPFRSKIQPLAFS